MIPRIRLFAATLSAGGLFVGCGSTASVQLVAARDAYREASVGPAAQTAPAELKTAEEALHRAEVSFRDDGVSGKTDDLAYIAERRAQIATAIANRRNAEGDKERYEKERIVVNDQLREQTVLELKDTKVELGQEEDRAARERAARIDAEAKTDKAQAETDKAKAEAAAEKAKGDDMRAALARWAQLVENERGLVITLSSGLLFTTGKSEVLPAAGAKLNEVTALLRGSPTRRVVVEGHTDSAGSDAANQVLSQARADAVRSYLVGQGVPAERVSAIGQGESKPIASNATTTGRATNRRVEIVLSPLPLPMSAK